jgi:hypothetical protein
VPLGDENNWQSFKKRSEAPTKPSIQVAEVLTAIMERQIATSASRELERRTNGSNHQSKQDRGNGIKTSSVDEVIVAVFVSEFERAIRCPACY